ncbi:hypothetical protein POM88_045499 [Heracleum sosnowskyi]|uniref:Uncharacterized protein n=1 Tax=Heracleum sosnowskyi TaxID=360622 RepID=A0AAD8H4S7_9APIA|nr:hypothetical protein POM88_045499 [Heracleum sosnowskyi]
MVANQYLSQSSNRQRIKQPASVPFIWEVRPGFPKKDWKHIPSITPVNPISLPPVKLISSNPFHWEEMPGKPLHCFPHEMPEASPLLLLPPAPNLVESESPTPTVYSQYIWDNADDDGCDGDDEKDEMINSYLDAWGFEKDAESISSAPSLLANRLIPSSVISNAVPVEENGLMGRNNLQIQQATCSPIYESDSSTSSYATGNTSLGDAPILERLFPLLLRKSSFLEELGCENGSTSPQTPTVPGLDPQLVSDNNLVVKRPLTLGEQILISRRRSYHRKAILMRDQNHSLEFMKQSVLGCCMVGSVNKMKRLQGKWKKHLQLKPS